MLLSQGGVLRETLVRAYDGYLHGRAALLVGGAPLRRPHQLIRPIFIIGSGRSGTTLLRRMLCARADLHIPPETYVLGEAIRLFRRNRAMPWRDLVTLIAARFEYYPEFETFHCTLRCVVNEVAGLSEKERSLAILIDAIYRYHARLSGKAITRWGDKTPLNTFHLRKIISVFPKAQFIHLVRDGIDVVQSYVASGLIHTYRDAAIRWCRSVRAAQSFIDTHPTQCLEVRYEQLVRQPEATAEKVCRFLELHPSDAMLQSEQIAERLGDVRARDHHRRVAGPIDATSIGHGRRKISLADRLYLRGILDGPLRTFGYPLSMD